MRLSLGPRVYQLTSRALVVAVVDGSGEVEEAARAIDDGADIVEVATIDDVAALHARFDRAVSFLCRDPQPDVAAAIEAGASLIDDRRGFLDADLVAAVNNTAAAVVLTVAPCGAAMDACDHLAVAAGHAEAAGISPDRIIIDAGLDAPRPPADRDALLQASTRLASLGRPLMASVEEVPTMAFVVARGARLMRVPAACAVQARRVRDTLAAVWEAQ